MNPGISVIIPTYNRAGLLPRAVNSVLAQSYEDFELIIVDDCSSDDTQGTIARFTDPRIRPFRHNQNMGVSAARNTGIADARGENIAFLDDDDEWLPAKLEKQKAILDTAPPQVGLVFGNVEYMNDLSGQRRTDSPPSHSNIEEDLFRRALRLDFVAHATALVKASVVRDAGLFDERLSFGEDCEWTCRLVQKWEAVHLREVVVLVHEDHAFRLTSPTELTAQLGRLKFLTQHIARYESELRKDPKGFSFVLRLLARIEFRLGNVSGAAQAAFRAFTVAPLDMSRAVLFNVPLIFSILTRKALRRGD